MSNNILFFLILFLSIILFNSIFCAEECPMDLHNFYLLPLIKEVAPEIPATGLHKYDYILILKTDPLQSDNYHMVFSVSFPINVNIELSSDIIYSFESAKKFCITDLTKEGAGRYINIVGKLSEYSTDNQILERIWIKIEKVLLNSKVEKGDKRNFFYLLTGYNEDDADKDKKKYLLMKKMIQTIDEQFFQIVRVKIHKQESLQASFYCVNSTYCGNNNNRKLLENKENKGLLSSQSNKEYDIPIGKGFFVKGMSDEDINMRDGLTYSGFYYDGTTQKDYYFENAENFICLKYVGKMYTEKCFSSTQVKFNLYSLISEAEKSSKTKFTQSKARMRKLDSNRKKYLREEVKQ